MVAHGVGRFGSDGLVGNEYDCTHDRRVFWAGSSLKMEYEELSVYMLFLVVNSVSDIIDVRYTCPCRLTVYSTTRALTNQTSSKHVGNVLFQPYHNRVC